MIQRTEEALFRLQVRREAYQTDAADTSLRNEIDILLKRSIVRLEESKESIEETYLSLERTMNQLKQNRRENELRAQQRARQRLGRGPSQ